MHNKYYLKHFDNSLLSFTMDTTFGLKIENIEIIDNNKDIYPVLLQNEVNENSIKTFIDSRIIPKNRAFVDQILSSIGLSTTDRKGIIDISKVLSLIDPYWIVTDNSLKFADYNLFDNDFSEVLSLVAFTGYHSKIKELNTSPELTTNGMLPKAWRRINNEVVLYKGSTNYLKASNTGFEPYSEYFISELADKLDFNHVKYNLDKWKNEISSTCPLFTSKEYSYVQIGDIVQEGGIEACARYLYKLGFYEDFANMILLDALTFNTDRHFGNFGLLRNNYTGNFTSLAPIFDNGMGLFSMAAVNEIEDKNNITNLVNAKKISYYDNISFDSLVERYCSKKHIKLLNKLVDFRFKQHSKYKISEKRINNLSTIIQIRAKNLIEILESQKSNFLDEKNK